MAAHGEVFASAGRRDQVRPVTSSDAREHEAHQRVVRELTANGGIADSAPIRFQLVDGQILDGAEHGLRGTATLCGIPAAGVFVMRHLFGATGRFACAVCAAAIAQPDHES